MKSNVYAKKRNDYSSKIRNIDSMRSRTKVVLYKAINEHLCCELNGEAVILSLKNGKYYGLNPVASRIWELIQTPITTDEIQKSILHEYDVESDMCELQVSMFLKQMADENLIEIIDEKAQKLF